MAYITSSSSPLWMTRLSFIISKYQIMLQYGLIKIQFIELSLIPLLNPRKGVYHWIPCAIMRNLSIKSAKFWTWAKKSLCTRITRLCVSYMTNWDNNFTNDLWSQNKIHIHNSSGKMNPMSINFPKCGQYTLWHIFPWNTNLACKTMHFVLYHTSKSIQTLGCMHLGMCVHWDSCH
jgi:hypothetical protein